MIRIKIDIRGRLSMTEVKKKDKTRVLRKDNGLKELKHSLKENKTVNSQKILWRLL